jgi:SAM-dependent methyltransferase
MYDFVHDISLRPEPFSRYTAKQLWTKPHLSKQMLSFHLNQQTDLASRRLSEIDLVVNWIDSQVGLSGNRLCDLGCGPGLYAERFAAFGATVTGIDFSENSIGYARKQTTQNIAYHQADYLCDELPNGFDIITLIYTDLCVLSPQQRSLLLGKMKNMLNPGGRLIIDVAGLGLLKSKHETTLIEKNLMAGFWSDKEYVGIQKSYIYADQDLLLDRYVIIERHETWQIYIWFQHYTAEKVESELAANGFSIITMAGNLKGAPLKADGDLIGVIATPL